MIDGLDGALAFATHEVGQRPGAEFFVRPNFMAHASQGARQPPQKMGVAMVPIRNQRVAKQRNVELGVHAVSAAAGASAL